MIWASGETQPWNNPEKMKAIQAENGEIEPEQKEANKGVSLDKIEK